MSPTQATGKSQSINKIHPVEVIKNTEIGIFYGLPGKNIQLGREVRRFCLCFIHACLFSAIFVSAISICLSFFFACCSANFLPNVQTDRTVWHNSLEFQLGWQSTIGPPERIFFDKTGLIFERKKSFESNQSSLFMKNS